MNKFLLSLLFFAVQFNTGFCYFTDLQSNQFPNYGIMQYFVPTQSPVCLINKPAVYFNVNFLPGKIITKSNDVITPNGIRYNIYNDEIECAINSQHSRISSPNKLKEVEIDGKLFVYKKYIHQGDSTSGFFQKIHSGTKNLYIKYQISQTVSQARQWNLKRIFYVETQNGSPKKVSSLKSEILSSFKEKEEHAIQFMKRNNFKWTDSKALVLLINYLENLSADNVASR
jgi:hypothetical protein